jgi:hypothetical protein
MSAERIKQPQLVARVKTLAGLEQALMRGAPAAVYDAPLPRVDFHELIKQYRGRNLKNFLPLSGATCANTDVIKDRIDAARDYLKEKLATSSGRKQKGVMAAFNFIARDTAEILAHFPEYHVSGDTHLTVSKDIEGDMLWHADRGNTQRGIRLVRTYVGPMTEYAYDANGTGRQYFKGASIAVHRIRTTPGTGTIHRAPTRQGDRIVLVMFLVKSPLSKHPLPTL